MNISMYVQSRLGAQSVPESEASSQTSVDPKGEEGSGVSPTGGQEQDAMSVLGKDAFMRLLLTQLRNQDPLQPMKDQEFLAQMAQFSALEQMQNLNHSLIRLAEAQSKAELMGRATALLGKTVEVTDEAGNTVRGQVTAVKIVNGAPQLMVAGQAYDLAAVVAIHDPGA